MKGTAESNWNIPFLTSRGNVILFMLVVLLLLMLVWTLPLLPHSTPNVEGGHYFRRCGSRACVVP